MMAVIAESNRALVRYINEVTWGTTPGSGVVKTVSMLNSSLSASKETQQSETIRADRMIPSIIEVAASTEGDIEFEFSAGAQDDFFQHFLLGTWSEAMTHFVLRGPSVTITANNTVTLTGADYTDYITDEDYIKLEGFKTPGNNGYFNVDAVAFSGGNTVVTVDGTLLTAEVGSAYTKFLDANDVILKSTAVALTSGNVIDGGTNAFLNKGLKVGQTIYLEGLGKGTGTLLCEATDPAEGDTITINDGTNSVVFEIRTNAALVAAGNVHVAFSGTPATLAASIALAINEQFRQEKIRCSAVAVTDTVTVTNHRGSGGSIAATGTGVTETTFSGGDNTKWGFYTIASLPDADTIVVNETLATDANGGTLAVIVKGSHLRNPGTVADITAQSLSAETRFSDIDKQFLHDGLRVGSFSKSITVGEIVTGSFSFMGAETTAENSTVLGDTGTYTVLDAPSTEPFNATANAGKIKRNGVTLPGELMSIELEGDAALRMQRGVGSRFPIGIGYGRFSLTGTAEIYFQDFTFFNDFLNHVTSSLSWDFEDVDHHKYIYTLPAVKFTADPIAPGGIDQDVMEPVEFMAFRDSSLNTMMMIDRFSSVYPMSAVA
jgi:hypothetical protein